MLETHAVFASSCVCVWSGGHAEKEGGKGRKKKRRKKKGRKRRQKRVCVRARSRSLSVPPVSAVLAKEKRGLPASRGSVGGPKKKISDVWFHAVSGGDATAYQPSNRGSGPHPTGGGAGPSDAYPSPPELFSLMHLDRTPLTIRPAASRQGRQSNTMGDVRFHFWPAFLVQPEACDS